MQLQLKQVCSHCKTVGRHADQILFLNAYLSSQVCFVTYNKLCMLWEN